MPLSSVKNDTLVEIFYMKKLYMTMCLLPLLHSATAQQTFTNFQNASLVIGQANFTSSSSNVNQNTLYGTTSSAISSKGVLACGSQSARRILIWNSVPTVNGANADLAIGVPDFVSTGTGCTQNSTSYVEGIAFSPDGEKMIVADAGNNRILIWNSIPTVNGQNADVVIGQTNFTSSTSGNGANKLNYPSGILVTPDGKLIVSDMYNNRVLIFNSIPTVNGASADLVIGQPNFTSVSLGCSATTMYYPWYLTLSTSGKLLIADHANHRVLVYNTVPSANGAAADVVIGQPTFTSNIGTTTQNGFDYPIGVTSAPDGKIAIAEYGNSRIVIYNTVPTVNGANADVVLGQPNFTSSTPFNGGISAQSMSNPYGISFDLNGRLFVNGRDMNRVMVFGSVPTQTAELSVSVASSASGLCANSSVSFTVSVTNNGTSTASNVIVSTALPQAFIYNNSMASAGSYTSASGLWNIPSIANGATEYIILNGQVNNPNPQTLSMYAQITNSQQYDNILSNNGVAATVTVTAGTPPSGGSVVTSTLLCENSTFSASATSFSNASNYAWSLNNVPVSGTSSMVTISAAAGIATISVVPSNSACPGTVMSQTLLVNSNPTVTANSSSSVICAGQTVTISANGASTYTWSNSSNGSSITQTLNGTSTFTVDGETNGCVSSTTITQSVTPNPTVTVASTSSLLCVGQTATLTASGASSYSWQPAGSGSTIAVSPTTTATYTVWGEQNNCSTQLVFTQNVSACTGLEKNDVSLLLSIYPNPNNGSFMIKSESTVKFNLVNSIGQYIQTLVLNEENGYRASVEGLSSGVYMILSDSGINYKIVVAK